MKPPYRCDAKSYQDYYLHQAGSGYPVYAGSRVQKGHGLGSVFGGLFKAAMPLLKKGAKTLGREALRRRGARKERQTSRPVETENGRKRSGKQGHRIRRTSWRKDYKKTCERKRPQTSSDQTTEHIERHLRIRDGPRTPTIVRMHEIGVGFVWCTSYPD